MQEFMTRLADCLDRDVLREQDVIVDFPEWDSLSVLTVIAMIDADYDVNLCAEDLLKVRTARDLWDLIGARTSR